MFKDRTTPTTAPHPSRRIYGIVSTFAALIAAGCGGGGDDRRVGISPPPPPPASPATSVELEPAFTGLSFQQPVLLLKAPGDADTWYVLEKAGAVRSFPDDPGAAASELWLDLRATVSSVSEGGLLGMAFHPDFPQTPEVFLNYTATGPFRTVISRFTVDVASGLPDPGSETIILEVPQPDTNHNGGNLVFGADGLLYVGLGDGGGAGDPSENGQDTTTLLGAILRLDVDSAAPYGIPAGNAFAGNTECSSGVGTQPCPEIFMWGLRNPWRFNFDADTGELWIGDVGELTWEEIDRGTGGENFGWDDREGAHCFEPQVGCATGSVDPITEYGRADGQSVTGGYVYRGSAYPSLAGQYLFGDFTSGRVWRVPAAAPQGSTPVLLADTAVRIVSFATDENDELFAVGFGGSIYRIVVP